MSHVSIIGGGNMGQAIATIVTKGGNSVEVFNSNDADKPVTGDVVFLAVPYPAVADVLAQRGDQLAGKVLVGISKNPLKFETFDPLVVPAAVSAAAKSASSPPRSRVLQAFSIVAGAGCAPSAAGPPAARRSRPGAPKGSARRWTGRWWNTWGTCDLVPVGNRVLVARPSLTTPFYGATELTVRGDVGRISQADGFGTFGEPARLVRDKRGRATALWLGGGQFDAHADDLPKRLARSNGRA